MKDWSLSLPSNVDLWLQSCPVSLIPEHKQLMSHEANVSAPGASHFLGNTFFSSDTYSKINQMKLSHAHNLVSIYALFTAFNGDGEDCVRAGAVLIHVGGTDGPWLKINRLKQSLIESQGTKWSLWLFCLRFLLPRVINLSMSSALYTTYPGRSLMYTPTSGLSFTCDDETQLYHRRLYMQMP